MPCVDSGQRRCNCGVVVCKGLGRAAEGTSRQLVQKHNLRKPRLGRLAPAGGVVELTLASRANQVGESCALRVRLGAAAIPPPHHGRTKVLGRGLGSEKESACMSMSKQCRENHNKERTRSPRLLSHSSPNQKVFTSEGVKRADAAPDAAMARDTAGRRRAQRAVVPASARATTACIQVRRAALLWARGTEAPRTHEQATALCIT